MRHLFYTDGECDIVEAPCLRDYFRLKDLIGWLVADYMRFKQFYGPGLTQSRFTPDQTFQAYIQMVRDRSPAAKGALPQLRRVGNLLQVTGELQPGIAVDRLLELDLKCLHDSFFAPEGNFLDACREDVPAKPEEDAETEQQEGDREPIGLANLQARQILSLTTIAGDSVGAIALFDRITYEQYCWLLKEHNEAVAKQEEKRQGSKAANRAVIKQAEKMVKGDKETADKLDLIQRALHQGGLRSLKHAQVRPQLPPSQ